MERKVGEVFNDGTVKIQTIEGIGCAGCCYWGKCNEYLFKNITGYCSQYDRKDNKPVKFIKIGQVKNIDLVNDWADCFRYFVEGLKNIKGESKMDNREELKRSLAEEEQRAKDSLANIEKMKKQLEELNKKEEQPTVSATGVYLNKISDNRYSYLGFDNAIFETVKFNEELENDLMRINNIFTTKEQAEQEALRREGQEFIRRCAMLWNKDNDWRKKKNIAQFGLYYDTESNKIIHNTTVVTTRGEINFDTQELAERCIKELNEKYNKEQQKTIFGVK